MKLDFCVSHNYTQRNLLLLLLKIVIKMLNKHENYKKESRNVVIDRKFTKNIGHLVEILGVLHNIYIYII